MGVGIVIALAAFAAFGEAVAQDAQRPNIVLMVVEDLGPRIGAFGDPVARTPNIDRLAAEGVRFVNAFATSGVCAPSRAALITGMYQQAIGAQHMRTSSFGRTRGGEFGTFSTPGPPYEAVPPAHVKAFPELLRAAGYFTMNNAKTDYQFGEPFTVWDRAGSDITLADRDPDKPFFFMLSNNTTHESGLFRTGYADKLEGSQELFVRNNRRLARLDETTDPARVEVPPFLPDTAEVRKDIARQYDNVKLMDDWVGARLAELEADGLLDSTVVIWTTDHGDGLPRAKRSLYDSGLHVPFVIRFPNQADAGASEARLVSFVDLAPTLLALAAVPIPDHLHGHDLLDDAAPPRRYVHAARDRLDELPDRSRAVRDARFKYIRNYLPGRPVLGPLYYRENLATMAEVRRLHREGALPASIAAYLEPARTAEELYDLAADPHEMRNIAGDPAYKEDLGRLRGELERWLDEVGDMSTQSEFDMVTRLMWPGGEQPVTAAPAVAVDCANDPASVTLRTLTPGASMAWRLSADEAWSLYAIPVHIERGASLEARAIRYGYRESAISASSVC